MTNQLTAMIIQDFISLLEDITDDTNIISSINQKTILQKTA